MGNSEIPRPACLIAEAAQGFRNAARALLSQAVRAAGIRGGHYMGEGESRSYGLTPRWIGDCTKAEFEKLMAEGRRLAEQGGWERFPFDSYHD